MSGLCLERAFWSAGFALFLDLRVAYTGVLVSKIIIKLCFLFVHFYVCVIYFNKEITYQNEWEIIARRGVLNRKKEHEQREEALKNMVMFFVSHML